MLVCLAIRYLSQGIWLSTVRVTGAVAKQTLPEQPVQQAFCSLRHRTNHDTLILFSSDNGQDAGRGQRSSLWSLWPKAKRRREKTEEVFYTASLGNLCEQAIH